MCMKEYRMYQYPRGDNEGGVLKTDTCPTISSSSWQTNCFLIEIEDGNIAEQAVSHPQTHSEGVLPTDGCMRD